MLRSKFFHFFPVWADRWRAARSQSPADGATLRGRVSGGPAGHGVTEQRLRQKGSSSLTVHSPPLRPESRPANGLSSQRISVITAQRPINVQEPLGEKHVLIFFLFIFSFSPHCGWIFCPTASVEQHISPLFAAFQPQCSFLDVC